MRWLTALRRMTRNGLDSSSLERLSPSRGMTSGPDGLGTVPIAGYGGLTGRELASAGASIAVRPQLATVEDLHHERERLEAFIERAAADVSLRNLRGSYWDLQSAEVEVNDEAEALAAEFDRLGRVEGSAIVGWVIRNAAVRSQRPIANLARSATSAEVSADALDLASTLLDSAQRLDPTDGGFLFSLRPRRDRAWRFRQRFGSIWVYGD